MKTIFKAILLAITTLTLFTGCSTQKKLNRAKQMVLLDPAARHEVFLKELQFFPCANDSIIELKPGAIDSATLSAYYDWLNGKGLSSDSSNSILNPIGKTIVTPDIDTGSGLKFVNGSEYLMRISKQDNGKEVITFGITAAKDVFDYAYKKGVKDYLQKHPPRFPDTLKTSIKDKQQIKVLEAALAKEKEENARLTGTVDAQAKEIEKKDKKITGWIWWFVLSTVLFLLTVSLALIGKIKKVFP